MTLVRPTCQKQTNQFFHGCARYSECSQLDQNERGSRFRWAPEHLLALGTLISLAYREKRQQADLTDASLTSTPTTTISTTVGVAFNLPSFDQGNFAISTVFVAVSETVPRASASLQFLRAPIAHRCIGQRLSNCYLPVANSVLD